MLGGEMRQFDEDDHHNSRCDKATAFIEHLETLKSNSPLILVRKLRFPHSHTYRNYYCVQISLFTMDIEQEDSGGSVIPSQKCPHLFTSALDHEGFLSDDSLPSTFKEPCDICQDSNENWLCLTCRMPVCSRFVNGHAEEHWIDTLMFSGGTDQHCLVLSTRDLSVWCYACSTYVKHDCLLPILVRAEAIKFQEPEKLARLNGCRSIFNVGIALTVPLLDDVENDEMLEMGRIEQRLNTSCLMSQLVHVVADNVSGIGGQSNDASMLLTKLLETTPSNDSMKPDKGIAILSNPQTSGKGSAWIACRDALVDQVLNPALLSCKLPTGSVPVTLLLLLYDLQGVLCGAECHRSGNDDTGAVVETLVIPSIAAANTEEGGSTIVQQLVQTHKPTLVVLSFTEADDAIVAGNNTQPQRSLFRFAEDGTNNIEIAVRGALKATTCTTSTSNSSSGSSGDVPSSISSSTPLLLCFTLSLNAGNSSQGGSSSSSSSSNDSAMSAAVETVARVLLE